MRKENWEAESGLDTRDVNHVARAICIGLGHDPDHDGTPGLPDWTRFRSDARVFLAANAALASLPSKGGDAD